MESSFHPHYLYQNLYVRERRGQGDGWGKMKGKSRGEDPQCICSPLYDFNVTYYVSNQIKKFIYDFI